MGQTWQDIMEVLRIGAKWSWATFEDLSEDKRRFRAVLNGLIGDSLEAAKSRLAIEMSLLGEVRGGKVCILVHGLCDSEDTWQFSEDPTRNYGSLLNRDFGYQPLFLRYNTGLHISTNGRRLAEKLGEMWDHSLKPVEEIVFIAHSLGGLVVRSACHYGDEAGAPWVKAVKKIFLLGVPHLGSDWEKLGELTSFILRTIPTPVTMGLAAIGDKRSAGIKDLRYGYLLDEDWDGKNFGLKNNRHHVALLPNVEYYLLSALLSKNYDNFFTQYFGDGLVATRSATGRSYRKSKRIPFAPESFKTLKGIGHGSLTRHEEVYKHIREWIGGKELKIEG